MSIFGAIKDAIFGGPAAAAEATTPSAMPPITVTPTAAAPSLSPVSTSPGAPVAKSGPPKVDVAAVLDALDEKSDEDLDWRVSIVDLMKLLEIDSSLKARKQLATELKYAGDMSDSATMNIWLHKQVMTKLAETGGVVPAELKH